MDNKELVGETIELVTEEPVQQEQKKGNNGIAVAVVTLLFVLVIGLCVYIAVSVSKMVPQSGQEDKEYESQTGDPWEEILGDDYIESENAAEDNAENETAYDSNNSADDFSGPYYQEVMDCIDESVPYEIMKENYDVIEEKNNVYISTSYIQLEGDIPGVDEINRLLQENTTFFAKNYEENKAGILEMLEETGTGVQAEIRSYVTYNTESLISIVVREDISMGYMYQEIALYCYNINLDTGTVLDNTSILYLKDGFGQEFRDRSNAQNGISESGIEAFSDEEIEAMLNDETSLIIFYTPLGMEVGYNYKNDTAIGWITITMQDYEEYLKRM